MSDLGVLGSELIDWPRVEANLGLVRRIVGLLANRHPYNREDQVDLFQDGVLGLARAVQKHDPERGTLGTYADSWIRQFIQKGCAERQQRKSHRAGRDDRRVSLDALVGAHGDFLASPSPDPADVVTCADLLDGLTPYELELLEERYVQAVADRHGMNRSTAGRHRLALRTRLRAAAA